MLERIAHGSILELRLAHPPANALTPELISSLRTALSEGIRDGASAVVLSGREGLFSAGLDVPHFLTLDRSGIRSAWTDFFATMRVLAEAPVPVVAALTGHSPAGGCVLSLFCDWRVMAEGKFKIGLNEVQVGLRMPRPIHVAAVHVVGTRQAERLCTTAELLPADEALRIGLVDQLVPLDEVVPRALEWAERVTALPPEALRKTRARVRRDLVEVFEGFDDEQLELFLDDWFSDETQGAMRALVERLTKK